MEGFYGGVALCSLFATTGAKLMCWPLWWLTGPIYGLMISTLGLLGDLTVSLFKRDAGVKDTGSCQPRGKACQQLVKRVCSSYSMTVSLLQPRDKRDLPECKY